MNARSLDKDALNLSLMRDFEEPCPNSDILEHSLLCCAFMLALLLDEVARGLGELKESWNEDDEATLVLRLLGGSG